MRILKCFLLFILMQSCYTADRDCSQFKTGDFTFNYVINGEEKSGRFTRSDSLNIDYYEGKVDSASVRWINDCEYVLVKLYPKTKQEEKAIHMKIISTTEDSYTFEYNFVGNPQKQRGVAYKAQ